MSDTYWKRCDNCNGTGDDPAGCNCGAGPGGIHGRHELCCGACEFCWGKVKERMSLGLVPVEGVLIEDRRAAIERAGVAWDCWETGCGPAYEWIARAVLGETSGDPREEKDE